MSGFHDIEHRAEAGHRGRAFAGAALLALLLLALWVMPLGQWFEAMAEWIGGQGVAGRVAFVALFVVATVLMVPGSILFAFGGYLFGLYEGAPLVWISVPLGAGCAALLARTLAREWLLKRFAGDPRFVAIDRAVAEKGWTIVTLSRLSLLMPFNLLNVLYGLTRIPMSTTTIGTWLGMTPSVVLYTYLGATVKDIDRIIAGDVDGGWIGQVLLVASIVLIIVVTVVIHRAATRALKQELEQP